jgi:predicted ATP-binding protein involved in virulence
MKLTQLEITNFRCFESLMVPLQQDVNVFVGVNASGKTTILDAIAIALYDIVAANGGGGKRQRALQSVNLRPSDIHMENGSQELVSGRESFVQIRTQAGSYYPLSDFPSQTPLGEQAFIEWTNHISYRPPNDFDYRTSRSTELSDLYRYFQALWQEIRRSDPKALIPIPVVAYYRSHRRLSQMPQMGDIFQSKMERQDAFEHALNAGASYQAMCQWFYLRENRELRERLQIRNDKNFEFPDLKAIRQAISETFEDVERVFFDDSTPSLKVAFSAPPESPQVLELEQLSDGYRNLLAVVLDFARRMAQAHPNWDNPMEAPGILLIDEIKLHLHPGWQQSVIPNLRKVFPNTQLIVATHSPQVLTTVRKEHVRCLTAQHNLEPLPAEIGTYGSESSYALEMVFGVHTRPKQTVETVGKLEEYLHLVEARQYASERAQKLRAELDADLGTTDPSLTKADIRIRQLEILANRR